MAWSAITSVVTYSAGNAIPVINTGSEPISVTVKRPASGADVIVTFYADGAPVHTMSTSATDPIKTSAFAAPGATSLNYSTDRAFASPGASISSSTEASAPNVTPSGDVQFGGAAGLLDLTQMALTPWQGYGAMRHVSVKLDGSGDFTDIQAAINSITDASPGNQYVVDVYDDIVVTSVQALCYQDDVTRKLPATTTITKSCALFYTKNWVHVRGVGSPRIIYLSMPKNLSASSYQWIQPIFVAGNVKLSNLIADGEGFRYAIHQDSGRTPTSMDRYATTEYEVVTCRHRGNSVAQGYPSGAWSATSAMANGTAPGQKQIFRRVMWQSENNVPFYFHSNSGFDSPTEHYFEDCSIQKIGTAATPATVAPGYIDLGSGQVAKIVINRCNFSRFVISQDIYSDERTRGLENYAANGGAVITGAGNAPRACVETYADTLLFRAIAYNVNISVTGGTAYADIWGSDAFRYVGTPNSQGRTLGSLRIAAPTVARGNSQIYSLAYRLGNCAAVPKTLEILVGATPYTITFDQNYMTADGSPYNYDTTPAISQAAILATINAIASSVFQAGVRYLVGMDAPNDCKSLGSNASASSTLLLGAPVVRDTAAGWDNWRLATAGEAVQGVPLERMSPGAVGWIADITKNLLPCYAIGLGASVTVGAMYKANGSGGFVVTLVTTEADLIAVDTVYLRGYRA